MVSLTLSVVPVMKQQLDATMEAQLARGLNVNGNLAVKLRAYLAMLIPVVVKSLVRAYGMAALLHVRGYGSGRRVKRARAPDRIRDRDLRARAALGRRDARTSNWCAS